MSDGNSSTSKRETLIERMDREHPEAMARARAELYAKKGVVDTAAAWFVANVLDGEVAGRITMNADEVVANVREAVEYALDQGDDLNTALDRLADRKDPAKVANR